MDILIKFIEKNGLILAFLTVGIIMYVSNILSKKLTNNKVPSAAIGITLGLVIAYFGGVFSAGEKGIADIKLCQIKHTEPLGLLI